MALVTSCKCRFLLQMRFTPDAVYTKRSSGGNSPGYSNRLVIHSAEEGLLDAAGCEGVVRRARRAQDDQRGDQHRSAQPSGLADRRAGWRASAGR